MNSPSPVNPQASSPEQKQQGRKRFYVAFFTIVSLNAVFLMLALFIQGCKRPADSTTPGDQTGTGAGAAGDIAAAGSNVVDMAAAAGSNVVAQGSNIVNHVEPPAQVPNITPAIPVATEHTIAKGDTLTDIAKKYNVSVKAIKAANPTVDEKKLQIGHKLVIPAPIPVSEMHSVTTTGSMVADTGEQVYEVKSGDTLGAIAKAHGTTVKAIQDLNALKDTRIVVKQKLKLPAKAGVPPPAPAPVTEAAPAVPAPAATPR